MVLIQYFKSEDVTSLSHYDEFFLVLTEIYRNFDSFASNQMCFY